MHCHLCEKAAIGLCRQCYKFYCDTHGDGFCDRCQQKGWSTAQVKTTPLVSDAQVVKAVAAAKPGNGKPVAASKEAKEAAEKAPAPVAGST